MTKQITITITEERIVYFQAPIPGIDLKQLKEIQEMINQRKKWIKDIRDLRKKRRELVNCLRKILYMKELAEVKKY